MNIIRTLTLRNLKMNKKRTIMIIIGVTLCVTMITAVATIGFSLLKSMSNYEITQKGEWHVKLEEIETSQIESIKNDNRNKETFFSKELGFAKLDGAYDEIYPFVYILEYDDLAFEKLQIHLTQGWIPQNSGEILVSNKLKKSDNSMYAVGDKFTVHIGKRIALDEDLQEEYAISPLQPLIDRSEVRFDETQTKEYVVSGIIDSPQTSPYRAQDYSLYSKLDNNSLNSSEPVNAYIIKSEMTEELFTAPAPSNVEIDPNNVEFNRDLLRYNGLEEGDGFLSTLISFSVILIVIIMIGSISLIFNAFSISLSERSRYLGMMSSVGATKRQKRYSVYFEGIFVGAIGIPLGIIFGIVGIGLTFKLFAPIFSGITLSGSFKLELAVSWLSIVIALVISILTIFISTLIPAKRASKISAISAIRQTNDQKLTSKQLKTSKLTTKIFGFEASLGLKNLKRSKGRYRTTVISLAMSVILFLAASSFVTYFKKSYEITVPYNNYDLAVDMPVTSKSDEVFEDILTYLDKSDYASETSFQRRMTKYISFKEDYINPKIMSELKEASPDDYSSSGVFVSMQIKALDDNSLKKYAETAGIDISVLKDASKPSCILVNSVNRQINNKSINENLINLNVGETLGSQSYVTETSDIINKNIHNLKVAATSEEIPLGSKNANLEVLFIVSNEVMETLIDDDSRLGNPCVFIRSSEPQKLEEELIKLTEKFTGQINIYNPDRDQEYYDNMFAFVNIFAYGFIILISLICVVNVFNTTHTSIGLREKEFAMLKSVGMTPKGFNKMINYESIFYGLKALLYGLPISLAIMVLMYYTLVGRFSFPFFIPISSLIVAIVSVLLVVSLSMMYSSSKIKKRNVIDGLMDETW